MASDIPPDRAGRAKARPSAPVGRVKGSWRGKNGRFGRRRKAVFLPVRQAALPRLPLDPGGRRCQGREQTGRTGTGLSAGGAAPAGQAIVTGIGGDGRRPAPCHRHRARSARIERMARTSPNHLQDLNPGPGGRFPQGSGKPFGASWERGFPPPAPFAGEAGSLRPRPRRPAALRLENEFGQRSRAGFPCRSRRRDVKRARRDPETMKSIGEIGIAPGEGRDFGNSRRAGSGGRAAAGASA